MAIKNMSELVELASGKANKKRVAIIGADDEHSLEALIKAKGIVEGVLVGDPQSIAAMLRKLGEEPDDYNIVPVPEDLHPSIVAANLIHSGNADFLMKGRILTTDLLKGLLSSQAGIRRDGIMSVATMVEIPTYHKLLCVTDSGMVPHPNFEEKKAILTNAVHMLHALGYDNPSVAAVCSIEVESPRMPETIDAAKLKQMSLSGELPHCTVEGPISYDLAMDPKAAEIKGYECAYTGNFDILLVPNIVVGNVYVKCLSFHAGLMGAGLVLGGKVPIVLTSRGTSAIGKFRSLMLAACMSSDTKQ